MYSWQRRFLISLSDIITDICLENEFNCGTGFCIDTSGEYDGFRDCHINKADEETCGKSLLCIKFIVQFVIKLDKINDTTSESGNILMDFTSIYLNSNNVYKLKIPKYLQIWLIYVTEMIAIKNIYNHIVSPVLETLFTITLGHILLICFRTIFCFKSNSLHHMSRSLLV